MTTRNPRIARVLALIVATATLLGGLALTSGSAGADDPAPVTSAPEGQAIPGEYIVVLKPGRGANERRSVAADAQARGGQVRYEYTTVLNGFAANLPPQALNGLQRNPNVAYIEADQVVTTTGDQANPPWGLDRVDQRNRPLNSNYHYDATGAGVKAYIVDTGMRLTHGQFTGRAINGYDAIDGGTADDCNGHGTHVAGTVGGSTYGVAKGVTLVAVRVLNCQGSGSNSQVIAGLDWVTGDHQAGQRAVANMSLTGGASTALDSAVSRSIADGIAYAVAAGNDNGANACTRSPARLAAAITVSATTSSDVRASYANVGSCLDLFAPGSGVLSAWRTSDTATNTLNGTSMATPHVAGAAALYLETTSATPQQVRDHIVGTATSGVVSNAGSGSPNLLLYTLGSGGSTTTTPTTAPTTTSPTTTAPTTTAPTTTLPPSGSCASETFTGTLSGTNDYDAHPNGTYWQAPAGTHYGCLTGPTGADFDLALYRWNGFSWSRVALSDGSSSTESITYNGTAGYYYWRVISYSGSGSYTLRIKRP